MAIRVGSRPYFQLNPASRLHIAWPLVRLASQAFLLTVIYLVGMGLATMLKLPLPGNVIGLLLLLGLLASGVIRPAQIDELCSFVLKHLTFFFVPLAVGLMTQGGLFASAGSVLVGCLVGAAAVGIATAGLVAQALARRGGYTHADQ
jgi:holin-like protein